MQRKVIITSLYHDLMPILDIDSLLRWLPRELTSLQVVPAPLSTWRGVGGEASGLSTVEVHLNGISRQVLGRDALQSEVAATGLDGHVCIGIIEFIVSPHIQNGLIIFLEHPGTVDAGEGHLAVLDAGGRLEV